MKSTRLVTLWLLVLLAGAVPAASAADNPAIGVVERLHATLLEAMQGGEKLGFSGRYALLEPVVHELFDFDSIARIVVGSSWRTISDRQRDAFLAVFRELSVATYASNFANYAGQRFVTLDANEKRGAMIVRTMLEQSDSESVSLNYMLRKRDDSWHIVSVVAQGVSDLSMKRVEYGSIIEKSDFDSLLNQLAAKVAQMSK